MRDDALDRGMGRRMALVLWPSFIVGGLGVGCFFSLFDPATLPFSDTLLPFDQGTLGQSRVLIYTAGFFIFWMFAAASSGLTWFLQRSAGEVNAAEPNTVSPTGPGGLAENERDQAAVKPYANQPDFSRPLELLLAGHDRIEACIGQLQNLAARVKRSGCNESARDTAAQIMHCFNTVVRQHHDDEELELSPRLLRRAAGQNAERAALLVAWLTDEHRKIDSAWEAQRSLLERIAGGETVELSASAIDRFAALYRGHIAVEEQQLLPLATALLSYADVAEIGAAMARRRGFELTT